MGYKVCIELNGSEILMFRDYMRQYNETNVIQGTKPLDEQCAWNLLMSGLARELKPKA